MGKRRVLRRRMSVVRQCALLVVALFCSGVGVAMATRTALGTSPISSFPYVAARCLQEAGLGWVTFGVTTFLLSILFVLGQVAILGRRFPPFQYAQVALGLIFGFFVDVGMWLCGPFITPDQPMALQFVWVVLGCVVMAAGISLQFHADLLLNPGEGIVKALTQLVKIRLAWVKLCVDVTLVILSATLALLDLHRIEGLGLGTVVAAFGVGLNVRWVLPATRPVKRLLFRRPAARG